MNEFPEHLIVTGGEQGLKIDSHWGGSAYEWETVHYIRKDIARGVQDELLALIKDLKAHLPE